MVVSDLQVDPGQRFEPAVEYSHVLSSIRHFSGVRLVQLLIFFLVMGGLLSFLLAHRVAAADMGSLTARAFGCFVTIIFWLMDVRAGKQYFHMLRRAQTLERILHFHSYLERPENRLLRSGVAIRLLYGGTLVWWLSALASLPAAE